MTLVEVMVAIAVFGVVSGMIFQIFTSTQQTSVKMIARQSSVDYAVFTADQVAGTVRKAVNPANLDDAAGATASFNADGFSVPSYAKGAGGGLFQVTVRSATGEDAALFPYEVETAPLGGGEATIQGLGMVAENFTPTVTFRYAKNVVAGQPVQYVDSLAPGEWPSLVQVRVHVTAELDPDRPVDIQTSVVPGIIGSSGVAVAAVAVEQPVEVAIENAIADAVAEGVTEVVTEPAVEAAAEEVAKAVAEIEEVAEAVAEETAEPTIVDAVEAAVEEVVEAAAEVGQAEAEDAN